MDMKLPEEDNLWKEKIEQETTEDQSDELFVPARLAEPTPEDAVLIRVIL